MKKSIGEKALDWIEGNWFRLWVIIIMCGMIISAFKACILSLF